MKYIIRLDDAAPTMSRNWERMEMLLDRYNVKPIVAVIPDNQDPAFSYVEPRRDFWDIVRMWQQKGWGIAMHGYQHVYQTHDGGLVPINNKSEFAGLSFELQQEKIKKGWSIFMQHNIIPTIWVAPAHSFDDATLRALKAETPISIVSDGIALNPFLEKGFSWIPQQLWSFKYMPFGTYTICLHPNTMTDTDFARLEVGLNKYKKHIVSVADIKLSKKRKTVIDRLFAKLWWYVYKH